MNRSTSARIVITGAPASGKTVLFERLRADAAWSGFLFFEELARAILVEKPEYRKDRGAFHREIYRRQAIQEEEADDSPFVTDRGTVDAYAFHPETLQQVGTTLEREYRRYTTVVQLGSSASLGERYYVTDEVRNESREDALTIEKALSSAWSGHPGYYFVEADVDFERKQELFLKIVMPLASRGTRLDNSTGGPSTFGV